MFENFWNKAEEFTKDERGAVTTERIEPGEYTVGRAVEMLADDANVAEAVKNYQSERLYAAQESHYGGEAEGVMNAEKALRLAIENWRVRLEPVTTETGGDITLATFAEAFEKYARPQQEGAAEVVEFPGGQQPEAETDDSDRREAA